MKKLLFLNSVLVFFLGNIIAVQAMSQEQEIQDLVQHYFRHPNKLEQAKKITPEIQAYLDKLHQAAIQLDLQAQSMEIAKQLNQVEKYKQESEQALKNFKSQTLLHVIANDSGDPVCFLFEPQTTLAHVIYLRYNTLFTRCNSLPRGAIQIIHSLTLSDNQEIRDYGNFLLLKYARDFHDQEQAQLNQRTNSITCAGMKYLAHRAPLDELKKYVFYIHRLSLITKEWFKAVTDDINKTGDRSSVEAQWKDYDRKAHTQRAILINLYEQNRVVIDKLYSCIYEQLQAACALLKNSGIPRRQLIAYKNNPVLNTQLPVVLRYNFKPVLYFQEYYQNYKDKHDNKFSFLDETWLAQANTRVTHEQSAKLPDKAVSEIKEHEQYSSTVILESISSAKKPRKITDTGRYVIDESHALYTEIYDRSNGYTYVLYRVIHPDATLEDKPYRQFEYDERVSDWFTQPYKRLQEDGYILPGHKYYTLPHKYDNKILLHAFAPIIDDYIGTLGYELPSPYKPQTDKNIRILGELRKTGKPTKYVYFTYNIYKKEGQWRCNHRCIEIKPKSEFLQTHLEQAKWDVHFPAFNSCI